MINVVLRLEDTEGGRTCDVEVEIAKEMQGRMRVDGS